MSTGLRIEHIPHENIIEIMKPQFSVKRALAVALLGIGFVLFTVGGCLESKHPRSNDEDDIALCVLGVGTVLMVTGYFLLFTNPVKATMAGLLSPCICVVLLGVLYWVCVVIYFVIHKCFN
jgi:hypothetical protein